MIFASFLFCVLIGVLMKQIFESRKEMMRKHWKLIAAAVSVLSGIITSLWCNPTAFKVGLTALAESLFWIGLLQIDSMFWFYAGYENMKKVYWVPELKISAKNAFIIFCGSMIFGFHALIVLLLVKT